MGSRGPTPEPEASNRIHLKPGPGLAPRPPSQPPSRKAVLQARRDEGVFLPKKILNELELLEQADDLPEAGSYLHLLDDERPPIPRQQKQEPRPSSLGKQTGNPRAYPKQVHWEEGPRRRERPDQLPWHIRHAQRERNPSGQTDAQEAHYNRNAEISKKAAEADLKRKEGARVPWYVRARQEKRARKQVAKDM